MTRALCIGECMVELRAIDATTMRVGYAGDTYNAAVYLWRSAAELGIDVEVGYLTGLGTDEFSTRMRDAWEREHIRDQSISIDGALPGLYTVHVDDRGERRFSYWRSGSAAQQLFSTTEWVDEICGEAIHLSGVTLQLLSEAALGRLVERLAVLRQQGALISFDTNYRSVGWSSPQTAAAVMDTVSTVATVVFATFDDERAMHGCRSAREAAQRLENLNIPEIVVKSGADGALVVADNELVAVEATPVARVVDTTAAGDSFAGGYLAARIGGRTPVQAADIASQVAATVVTYPGAIAPSHEPLLMRADRP